MDSTRAVVSSVTQMATGSPGSGSVATGRVCICAELLFPAPSFHFEQRFVVVRAFFLLLVSLVGRSRAVVWPEPGW